CVACSAWISDRVGRRRVMLWGLVACLPWAFVVIPLIDTGRPVCYVVAVLGMFGTAAVANGPTAAFVPELFATRYRYSGAAVAM
ncbi:MFS transporter, partial [Escherichia coli]